MIPSKSTNSRNFLSTGLGLLAAAVLVSCGAGCSQWNLRGEGFNDNSMSSTVRQARKGDHAPEFMGYSNKAQEINNDFRE
jgi:hypothetical protein